MAKSTTSRKSLKSLFSRGTASASNPDSPAEKEREKEKEKDVDKNEGGEKKRFAFLKFKTKPKPASNDSQQQQVFSDPEPSNTVDVDGEASVENVFPEKKRFSLYGTTPKSKGKELSYSEMDLRKPKKFRTFSFGLRKKKKREEGSISKSTFDLDSPGIEEPEEASMVLSPMVLDPKRLSMSQPVLDTGDSFDIPSPPPVATNPSGSYFNLPNQSHSSVNIDPQPEVKEPLTNGSNLSDEHKEPRKAPIATIPELQLDYADSTEEKKNIPVDVKSSKSDSLTHTEAISVVDNQTVPVLTPSQPPIVLDGSDGKAAAAVVETVFTRNTETETSLAESTVDSLSYRQQDTPDVAADRAKGEPALSGVDFEIDTTMTRSTPVASSVTTTPAVSGEQGARSESQDEVYGALYDSLFPQNFTTELFTSLLNSPSQINPETRHLNTRSEEVTVQTLNETYSEKNVMYSRLSTSRERDLSLRRMDGHSNINATFNGREGVSSSESSRYTSYRTSSTYNTPASPDIHFRYLPPSFYSGSETTGSDDTKYAEQTSSPSEVKSDRCGLFQDSVRSAAEYATPQGTDTQVTDSIQRVILVKEIVAEGEEEEKEKGCPSTVPEKHSSTNGLNSPTESCSSPAVQMDGHEGLQSPAYLSVGSDDSSAMEIYYSAEEDNAEESGDEEEMQTMVQTKEVFVVDRVEQDELCEDFPQQVEIAERSTPMFEKELSVIDEVEEVEISEREMSKTEEGLMRVVIVKTQSSVDETEDIGSQGEVQRQLNDGQSSETWTSEFLAGNDAKSEVTEVATAAYPPVKDAELFEEFSEQGEIGERGIANEEREVCVVDEVKHVQLSEEIAQRKITYVEREEVKVVEELKEVEPREEIPEHREIKETGISKRDEGHMRVVIVKMRSVDETEDIGSHTEVQQQINAVQSSSEFLMGFNAKREEDEGANTMFSQVKDTERGLTVVESEAVLVVDTVKEAELPEELPQGLFVKTQRDGGTADSVEEEKEDISSQTELPDGQSLKTWTSEILTGSGAKASEEKEVATTAFSHVKDAGLREEFLKQDEIADREMTYVEREEVSLADRVEQVELRSEEFSQHVEMAGTGTSQRDEEELKVEIGQIQREGEGAMGSDEEKEDIGSQTEVQQQLNDGPSSEIGIPEFMASSYAKSEENEEEEATMAYPQVKDASLIEEILHQGEITEREITYVEKVEVVSVVDKMKDADLSEEFPKQGEIEETGLSKRDEGQSLVLTVKEQNDGGKMSDEEEKEHISKQTEVHQIPDGSEQTGTFEFQTGNDAKSEETATTSFPWLTAGGQVETEVDLQAPPVRRVNTVMVCDLAPPSSEPYGHMREGAEGNQTGGLVTEDPPIGKNELPTSQAIQCVASVDLSSDYILYTAASSNSGEEDWITPKLRAAEEQVCELREEACKENTDINSGTTAIAVADTSHEVQVVSGTLTDRAELEWDATEKSCEWVDTIVQSSADRTGTPQEQVTVELSIPNADTQHPDTQAADTHSERHQHPSEAQPDLNGSLTDSLTPTAASEFSAPENQPIESDQESVDKMNLGYSSLSTKLSINTSSTPKEDEANYRFGKVSLTSEADSTTVTQDTVDFNKTSTTVIDTNGPDLSSSWRNRFEEDSQYKPYTPEESSFTESLRYRMSDTSSRVDEANAYTSTSFLSSSSLPKATAYTHLGDAYSSSLPSTEERITLGNRLTDRTKVYPSSEWRSGLVEGEGPAAPAGEREQQREGEAERIESRLDSEQLLQTDLSSPYQYYFDTFKDEGDDSSRFSGLFKATLVELVSDPAAPPSTPPASPTEDSTNQFDMDSLVDTLKSMGPSLRQRSMGQRGPPPSLMSSLPPIVEDAPLPAASEIKAPAVSPISPAKPLTPITSPSKSLTPITSPSKPLTPSVEVGKPAQSPNGLYTLPGDFGLKKTAARDNRSPLELMKQTQQQGQQQPGTKGLTLPLRQSAISSIVMRTSSDSSPDELKSPVLNGNGVGQSSSPNSRLENSVVFGSYRSPSLDKPVENKPPHRPLFRTGSLPDSGPSNDRVGLGHKELGEPATGAEPAGSRFDRFSFLLNSTSNSTATSTSSSLSGSLTGSEDFNSRLSRAPQLNFNSPTSGNSPKSLLSPASSLDLHKPFTNTTSTDSSLLSRFGQTQGMGMGAGTGAQSSTTLQRSFNSEGTAGLKPTSLFNSVQGGSQFQSQKKEPEPDKNLATKYRAFPDAYLTKTKEHGKLNPRPGKMYIYDRPGMTGQRIDIRSDVHDATSWDLGETISIRVIRGGWVLYELPKFRGEKIALDEGDLELTNPFNPPEEPLQNGQTAEKQNGEAGDGETESKPARKFVIGSLRRAVRDYSVPEISLFPEENAEGKKVTFRDTSEDARIFGFPIKANSVIVNAGLWLVYAHPFFQGVPRVLEVGGYSTPASWGVEQPYVGSVHPLKIAEPRVENISEPKIEIYDKPYFSGKSRIITTNMRDFITKTDQKQKAFMHKACSIKVHGGIWVGYEKEGFRGHQYLLEEGEYQDWRVWGGCDGELRSLRVIRADLSDPLMVMFEQPEEEHEETADGNTFEVSEAIPDVELFEYKTSTRSINVVSGAWVAYSQVDFSGNQFILEKGFYNNCADWGSHDNRICSVQPILPAPSDSSKSKNEVILYADTDFQGAAHVFDRNTEELPEKLLTKSCRVSGGSWVLYDDKKFLGNMYVLFEGDYPNLTSMGCPIGNTIRSVRVVPLTFSVPSISLFGLECQEGREITIDTEIFNMVEEGFNNHILSVRVNSGTWVICEHSNYRGRQFLLEPIEITNWPKFSSIQTVGSMFPVRQKRHYFRIKNKEKGHFMSIQGGVEEMKSGRLVVLPEVEPMTDIWYYQDGLIKSKLAQTMSLQAMGKVEPGSKVVLWSETRQPIQSWAAQTIGLITSLTFPGMVLDLKGGKTYDKDHVVMMPENDERPSQQWEIELL